MEMFWSILNTQVLYIEDKCPQSCWASAVFAIVTEVYGNTLGATACSRMASITQSCQWHDEGFRMQFTYVCLDIP